MVSLFMVATCAVGAIAAAVLTVREVRAGRLVAMGGAGDRPGTRTLRESDGVVWETVSAHFAMHRQQCARPSRCAHCRVYRDVLSGLLARGGGPPARSALERKVTEALAGHVPDAAGLCRACVSGRSAHHGGDQA